MILLKHVGQIEQVLKPKSLSLIDLGLPVYTTKTNKTENKFIL